MHIYSSVRWFIRILAGQIHINPDIGPQLIPQFQQLLQALVGKYPQPGNICSFRIWGVKPCMSPGETP